MIRFIRTDSNNKDFITLVRFLDDYLHDKDGDEHSFYAQYNKIDKIRNVIVAYQNEIPVSCGAIKEYEPKVAEVKRMYTVPEMRGKGIATQVLMELEKWAAELSFTKCILETGKKQIEAVALYTKNNYCVIPNYGQYANIENSICFEKVLK